VALPHKTYPDACVCSPFAAGGAWLTAGGRGLLPQGTRARRTETRLTLPMASGCAQPQRLQASDTDGHRSGEGGASPALSRAAIPLSLVC
jgi:hypothetical protein